MRSTFKTVFYVNGSKEKNGIVPIMGRVTINGTIAQFSCKQSISKELWDAKGKSREAVAVNYALDNIKAQITKHYQRLSDREAFVTAEMVRNAYQGIGTEYETLLRAFDKENEAFAKRVGKDRSKRTYQKYLTVRKYVAEFIKRHYKRTDMAMNELTEDFIRDYCLYLRNEVGLAQSSVWIYSIPLKHIVTTAHYNGKIPRNPFAMYHVDPRPQGAWLSDGGRNSGIKYNQAGQSQLCIGKGFVPVRMLDGHLVHGHQEPDHRQHR